MSSCNPFNIDFSESPQDLFNKVSTSIHNHGGTISGGPSGGAFSVPISDFIKVAGVFSISVQTCTIQITRHPFFIPCDKIESFIRDNFPTVEKTAITDL